MGTVADARQAKQNAASAHPPAAARAGERLPVTIHDRPRDASAAVARAIAGCIRAKAAIGERCVLGLATGSTPTSVYEELVRMHRDEGLSFANVVTFNLDEYWPMAPNELQSYRRFMDEHLFSHVDVDPANVHLPSGTVAADEVQAHCESYERMIAAAGGIDIQLLGIGRTGHVGFNEPGSSRASRTRLITLDRVTRKDAASDFFGEEHVPLRALTMGIATILEARRIVLLAFGEGKADVVSRLVEGPVTDAVPATFLQGHPCAEVHLDQAAAGALTRRRSPWVTGPVAWDPRMVRKAVAWLAATVRKPVLKLTNEDYNEHHLQDLLAIHGRAHQLNLQVFRDLQETITGWPGGKPAVHKQPGDIDRPRDRVFPKRVLVFSPHPDDDVISMGGTLIRLVDQGHEVHVAYQTSGNIAVFDGDALRFLDFASDFNARFGFEGQRTERLEVALAQRLRAKRPGEVDAPQIQELKALIRRGEAKAACALCGIPDERAHFLDMPFYETGRVRKRPIGEEDVRLTVDLLRRIEPHQVYAAGDLSDPHGTHRACLNAVFRAFERVRGDAWRRDCEVLLYRGAWQEWDVEDIDMAVPLSPEDVTRKRLAIFKHQSQKDRAPFPGIDDREFWQRAEQRNAATAARYDALGLAEYQALEAFKAWDGSPLD